MSITLISRRLTRIDSILSWLIADISKLQKLKSDAQTEFTASIYDSLLSQKQSEYDSLISEKCALRNRISEAFQKVSDRKMKRRKSFSNRIPNKQSPVDVAKRLNKDYPRVLSGKNGDSNGSRF